MTQVFEFLFEEHVMHLFEIYDETFYLLFKIIKKYKKQKVFKIKEF